MLLTCVAFDFSSFPSSEDVEMDSLGDAFIC